MTQTDASEVYLKIYLAVPYNDKDPKVRQERFDKVNLIAARLMNTGLLIFSPISHTHPIAQADDLPKDWAFWQRYDITFIEWCDEMYVLQLPGWKESVGVQAEIKIARRLNKPIVYLPVII